MFQKMAKAVGLLGMMTLSAQATILGDMSVQISGLGSCKGSLMLAVYDKAAGFMQIEQAVAKSRIPLSPANCEPSLTHHLALAYGEYALAVFHDDNGNGVLDSNWLGMPTETWGVSNKVRPTMRAPDFGESCFSFTPTHTYISIDLQ